MTVEYIVLGAILIVMGAVQTYLRHGPGGRALRAEQEELAQRRAEARAAERAEEPGEAVERPDSASKAERRTNKAWTGWTAILGGLSIALGIVLLVLGVLGR